VSIKSLVESYFVESIGGNRKPLKRVHDALDKATDNLKYKSGVQAYEDWRFAVGDFIREYKAFINKYIKDLSGILSKDTLGQLKSAVSVFGQDIEWSDYDGARLTPSQKGKLPDVRGFLMDIARGERELLSDYVDEVKAAYEGGVTVNRGVDLELQDQFQHLSSTAGKFIVEVRAFLRSIE